MKKVFSSDNHRVSGEININVTNSKYSDYLFVDIETDIIGINSTIRYQYKCSTVDEIRKLIEDAEKDFQKILNDFSISEKCHLLEMFQSIINAKKYV